MDTASLSRVYQLHVVGPPCHQPGEKERLSQVTTNEQNNTDIARTSKAKRTAFQKGSLHNRAFWILLYPVGRREQHSQRPTSRDGDFVSFQDGAEVRSTPALPFLYSGFRLLHCWQQLLLYATEAKMVNQSLYCLILN